MIKRSSCYILTLFFLFTITSPRPQHPFVPPGSPETTSVNAPAGFNCGPKVLLAVLRHFRIPAQEQELVELSDTRRGVSSFLGLSRAARSKGLDCVGVATDLAHLRRLKKDNQLVVHFSQNHHFVLIKDIGDKTVQLYDPALSGNTSPEVPVHLFLSDWDGTALVFNKELKIHSSEIETEA